MKEDTVSALRAAVYQDLQQINYIYNQAVSANQTAHTEPITIEERQIWFEEHADNIYPVLVYEDKQVCGWLSFSPYRKGREALKHTAEISFYVHENFQRQGIGMKL